MANTAGFEILEDVLGFGTTGVASGLRPSSRGFELTDDVLGFGTTGISSGLRPRSLGFVIQEADLFLSDSSGVSSGFRPRSSGFAIDIGVIHYLSTDTSFELIALFPEITINSPEVEMQTGDIRLTLVDGIATMEMNGSDLLCD